MNNEQFLTSVECNTIGSIESKSGQMPLHVIIEEKACSKCKRKLPLEMFNKSNGVFICYCRKCQTNVAREWRLRNLDKVRRREKSYRISNRDQIRLHQKKYMKEWVSRLKSRFVCWRKRARLRKIPFDLTLEQLDSMPLVCHYTGNALVLESNKWNTISLDRLDSSKGYTINNVVYCCSFVNLMKHTLSYDNFIESCKTIVNHYEAHHKS